MMLIKIDIYLGKSWVTRLGGLASVLWFSFLRQTVSLKVYVIPFQKGVLWSKFEDVWECES
jgi:hypothetical protein